jgi:hypothetical protein
MINIAYKTIDKEFIANIRWYSEDSAYDTEKQDSLMAIIRRACALGNTEKHKCVIKFRSGKKKYQTETTIWSFCREAIVLKYGITIPLNKIEDIVV